MMVKTSAVCPFCGVLIPDDEPELVAGVCLLCGYAMVSDQLRGEEIARWERTYRAVLATRPLRPGATEHGPLLYGHSPN